MQRVLFFFSMLIFAAKKDMEKNTVPHDELAAFCALNKVFGYVPSLALRLIEERGSAMAVFRPPLPELPSIPSSPKLSAQLSGGTLEWAARELKLVRESGGRFICVADDDYPQPLLECEDRPLGIYLRGSSSPAEIFQLRPMIGFVGTRDLSPYGREWCRKLVSAIAEAPVRPCIVSGLAYGADAVAHQCALEFGLPTVGVLPTGIDDVYPYRHQALADSIVSSPGSALVTDYPTGTAPIPMTFLRRNRIIAGLVSAVVVVESKSKGGSLMTAKYACGYSRDVFAVPGRLDDERSAGCNSLIANNMAQIVSSPEELVSRLGLGSGPRYRSPGGSWAVSPHPRPRTLDERLTDKYGEGSVMRRIGLAVKEHRGITLDELCGQLGLPYSELVSAVITMEMDGVLRTDILRRCALTPAYA